MMVEILEDVGVPVSLDDLAEGEIFDVAEVIIDRSEGKLVNMTTITREYPEDKEIRTFHYLVRVEGDRVTSIDWNGTNECYLGDKGYAEKERKLQEVGL